MFIKIQFLLFQHMFEINPVIYLFNQLLNDRNKFLLVTNEI